MCPPGSAMSNPRPAVWAIGDFHWKLALFASHCLRKQNPKLTHCVHILFQRMWSAHGERLGANRRTFSFTIRDVKAADPAASRVLIQDADSETEDAPSPSPPPPPPAAAAVSFRDPPSAESVSGPPSPVAPLPDGARSALGNAVAVSTAAEAVRESQPERAVVPAGFGGVGGGAVSRRESVSREAGAWPADSSDEEGSSGSDEDDYEGSASESGGYTDDYSDPGTILTKEPGKVLCRPFPLEMLRWMLLLIPRAWWPSPLNDH